MTLEWLDAKEHTPDENLSKALVVYLDPFFGKFRERYTTAYYDHPKHYLSGISDGWIDDHTGRQIKIVRWAKLPELTYKLEDKLP